jgi:thiamine pyrophosphokinase
VAVDGGYRFFARSGTRADLLIGDLDSLGPRLKPTGQGPRILEFPRAKNQTDAELALDYCLEEGATRIDIVQPGVGEPDHFLTNMFLLTRRPGRGPGSKRPVIRLVGPTYEARYLIDERWVIGRAKGSRFSLFPISASISLTCRGTEYDIETARIRRGQTRASRNRIVADRAVVEVSGEALLWRRFGPREGH